MSALTDNAVEFVGVQYRLHDDRILLSGLDLVVPRGQVFMLLGRSGSGKTTTLKLINRLLTPTAGRIVVDGLPTSEWDIIKLRRHIGYAIQEVGLFPHYTAAQNIGLIPRLESWDKQRIQSRIAEVLHLVGLPPEQFGQRYPHQLSGGERQRVGLARALAADPPILLMDEPFGALDPLTRVQLQSDFRRLQERLHKTVVFVTHDIGEALLLGDRIALMQHGSLCRVFTRREFLESSDPEVQEQLETFRLNLKALELED